MYSSTYQNWTSSRLTKIRWAAELISELIKCLRSRPQLTDLGLIKVQLTKKEATELCTLAIERNMYSFVIYIYFIF